MDASHVPQSYWDDLSWAREHSTELHQQFKGVWIAIVDKTVVAWGTNLARVEKEAAKKTGKRPEEIPVKFIERAAAIYGQNQVAF
jgi:hypothetical protein